MSSKVNSQPNVRVGVGVLVLDPKKKGCVFAGIRKGSHGAGEAYIVCTDETTLGLC
jgi:hypothetical protein